MSNLHITSIQLLKVSWIEGFKSFELKFGSILQVANFVANSAV